MRSGDCHDRVGDGTDGLPAEHTVKIVLSDLDDFDGVDPGGTSGAVHAE
jgi:hypothetical protein